MGPFPPLDIPTQFIDVEYRIPPLPEGNVDVGPLEVIGPPAEEVPRIIPVEWGNPGEYTPPMIEARTIPQEWGAPGEYTPPPIATRRIPVEWGTPGPFPPLDIPTQFIDVEYRIPPLPEGNVDVGPLEVIGPPAEEVPRIIPVEWGNPGEYTPPMIEARTISQEWGDPGTYTPPMIEARTIPQEWGAPGEYTPPPIATRRIPVEWGTPGPFPPLDIPTQFIDVEYRIPPLPEGNVDVGPLEVIGPPAEEVPRIIPVEWGNPGEYTPPMIEARTISQEWGDPGTYTPPMIEARTIPQEWGAPGEYTPPPIATRRIPVEWGTPGPFPPLDIPTQFIDVEYRIPPLPEGNVDVGPLEVIGPPAEEVPRIIPVEWGNPGEYTPPMIEAQTIPVEWGTPGPFPAIRIPTQFIDVEYRVPPLPEGNVDVGPLEVIGPPTEPEAIDPVQIPTILKPIDQGAINTFVTKLTGALNNAAVPVDVLNRQIQNFQYDEIDITANVTPQIDPLALARLKPTVQGIIDLIDFDVLFPQPISIEANARITTYSGGAGVAVDENGNPIAPPRGGGGGGGDTSVRTVRLQRGQFAILAKNSELTQVKKAIDNLNVSLDQDQQVNVNRFDHLPVIANNTGNMVQAVGRLNQNLNELLPALVSTINAIATGNTELSFNTETGTLGFATRATKSPVVQLAEANIKSLTPPTPEQFSTYFANKPVPVHLQGDLTDPLPVGLSQAAISRLDMIILNQQESVRGLATLADFEAMKQEQAAGTEEDPIYARILDTVQVEGKVEVTGGVEITNKDPIAVETGVVTIVVGETPVSVRVEDLGTLISQLSAGNTASGSFGGQTI